LVTACDIRLATQNAIFCLKEISIAVILEHGALSRLPKITNHSAWLREIAFTGRRFDAAEALKHCRLLLTLDCRVAFILIDLRIHLSVAEKELREGAAEGGAEDGQKDR
uniref:Rav1p_C domain-containing protein n=1 Tax=Steinernema glaseri TaxID=37863 RepID=A0A1I8AIS2_9BILA